LVAFEAGAKRRIGSPEAARAVLATPLAWRHADAAAEGARERRLVAETRMTRYVRERAVRKSQQFFGAFDSSLSQPLVTRDTEARLEGTRKVANRKLTLAREVREPHGPVEVFVQDIRRSRPLPFGEPTPDDVSP
jgi:hypothetical protein